MSKPVVAVAGATGKLGKHVSAALLSEPFKSRFSKIILLSRNEAPQFKEWSSQGAIVSVYSEDDIASSLKGVDVLINTIGSKGHHFKEKLLHALPKTSIKLYLPSEFGVDHDVHDFSHHEWDAKKEHCKTAKSQNPGLKVCRVFPGLFLEDSIGPWFGFNTKTGVYEAVGSADAKISFTSLPDLGKSVAAIASTSPSSVPERLHIAGTTKSFNEIAAIMGKAGAGEIKVEVIDLKAYKEQVFSEPPSNPGKSLRFLMGEGKIDHSKSGLGNDNDVVNPGENEWKWETMEDLARETKGRPWADY